VYWLVPTIVHLPWPVVAFAVNTIPMPLLSVLEQIMPFMVAHGGPNRGKYGEEVVGYIKPQYAANISDILDNAGYTEVQWPMQP